MALVVETGSGLATADSYSTLAAADSYLKDHGDHTAWFKEADERRERALRLATQYLDLVYGSRYRGTAKTSTQALLWPRSSAYTDDNYAIASTSIPTALARATAEAASREISETTGLLPDVAASSTSISEESVRVGPITSVTKYAGTKPTHKRFDVVEQLMRFVTEPVGASQRA